MARGAGRTSSARSCPRIRLGRVPTCSAATALWMRRATDCSRTKHHRAASRFRAGCPSLCTRNEQTVPVPHVCGDGVHPRLRMAVANQMRRSHLCEYQPAHENGSSGACVRRAYTSTHVHVQRKMRAVAANDAEKARGSQRGAGQMLFRYQRAHRIRTISSAASVSAQQRPRLPREASVHVTRAAAVWSKQDSRILLESARLPICRHGHTVRAPSSERQMRGSWAPNSLHRIGGDRALFVRPIRCAHRAFVTGQIATVIAASALFRRRMRAIFWRT